MAALLFLLLVLLCITGPSSASYCVCLDSAASTALQTDIDYACGAGADCTAILTNGACYQPNTVKSHCDYAVNSYYQKMGQAVGSCNFTGSATLTNTLPTTVASGCTFPASPSQVTTTTPTSSSTPNTNFTTPTTSSTSPPPPFAFAPTGTDTSSLTPSGSRNLMMHHKNCVSATLITFFLPVLLVLWA